MGAFWQPSRRKFLSLLGAIAAGAIAWPVAEELMEEADAARTSNLQPGLVPLVYGSRYNISAFGLEHLHPFDGSKFARIRGRLIAEGVRKPADFMHPSGLSREQLLLVHTPAYLESLKHSGVLAKIFEVGPAALVPATLPSNRCGWPAVEHCSLAEWRWRTAWLSTSVVDIIMLTKTVAVVSVFIRTFQLH